MKDEIPDIFPLNKLTFSMVSSKNNKNSTRSMNAVKDKSYFKKALSRNVEWIQITGIFIISRCDKFVSPLFEFK